MEAGLAALEATGLAQYLRVSRWGYAAVSGAHILGIALLIGAIVPLKLRLLGLWPKIPRAHVLRVLVPLTATGLAVVIPTGILLFSVRAQEYASIGFVQVKFGLVLVGILSAVMIHRPYGLTLQGASQARLRFHALLSMGCWLGGLACGRLIAFVVDCALANLRCWVRSPRCHCFLLTKADKQRNDLPRPSFEL